MMTNTAQNTEDAAVLAAARAGDEAAFSTLAEGYRRQLKVHAYRMLGSFDDAEDMVQETLLRAWRGRATFEGRSSLRAWLYGIATNACLDFLRKHQDDRKPTAAGEVLYLQPFPDRLLETKENIGLAFLAAIQFLPAKQRAALILCDVLDWSAKEAAELLELTVAAINSRAPARPGHAARAAAGAAARVEAGPGSRRAAAVAAGTVSSRPPSGATSPAWRACSRRTCASRCRPSRAPGPGATWW